MVIAPTLETHDPNPAAQARSVEERFGISVDMGDSATFATAVRSCAARRIVLPTFHELEAPGRIDGERVAALARVDPDAPDPRNLFRIHWFNAPDRTAHSIIPGHIVLPSSLTGVEAPIVVMVGDRFPMISAHKVLAAYGCLAPRLVTGRFDPLHHRAVWPSTGNYCRGGVAVSRIMGCRAVAVLPERMSEERYSWLNRWVDVDSDIIRTHGSESNVKEIYDACAILEQDSQNIVLNQFCEFGNALAHYRVTGSALGVVFESLRATSAIRSFHSFVSASGSAGTLAAGDRVKEDFGARIVAVEAAECPTLLRNGFGEHNIQGIGDKHVPYIHNVFNTDDVVAVSDAATDALFYMAGDKLGCHYLAQRQRVDSETITQLQHIGLSGWANIVAAIRIAQVHKLDATQAVFTVATDGAALYQSEREKILHKRFAGSFDEISAGETFARFLRAAAPAEHLELGREERERIFNLSYFTWVEQQHVPLEAFLARRETTFWTGLRSLTDRWDERIRDFNARVAAT